MIPSVDKLGYQKIFLSGKSIAIHRLVGLIFVPNPNLYKEINHKDGNKQNNNMNNLEWCSRSYNVKHAFDNKLKINKKGADCWQTREVYQYDLNGKFIKKYNCIKEASLNDNSLRRNISACCKGKIKTAGGFIWSYKFEEINPLNHEAIRGLPVYQYAIDGTFIKKWKNSKIAAIALGYNHSNICKVCRKERESANGFIWSYNYEILEKNKRLERKFSKIYQFDKTGVLIKEWNNVKEVSETLKLNRDKIRACCNKRKKTYNGYRWSYTPLDE